MVGRLCLLAFNATMAVALYISDSTRPVMCSSHEFGSSQLAEMTDKDVVVVLADHRVTEGSVLRDVDLTVVVYDIVNFLPLAPYACRHCCHIHRHICRSRHCIGCFRPSQVGSILNRGS